LINAKDYKERPPKGKQKRDKGSEKIKLKKHFSHQRSR